jgi:hypothetical protein
MKRCLVKMSLVACGALMATHAFAQSAGKTRAASPKKQTAAANVKAAKPTIAAMSTVTAAAGAIILADGIVANATVAQVLPPAEGFVYER